MTLIAALIAIVIVVTFLGWLAIVIGAVPLFIIIGIGIALILTDFYGAMHRPEEEG